MPMKEAPYVPDADGCRQVMEEELISIREKGSFKDESLSNMKPAKTRFVYKLEGRADGESERYKIRLVERGFTQRPRADLFETFSPVLGFDSAHRSRYFCHARIEPWRI